MHNFNIRAGLSFPNLIKVRNDFLRWGEDREKPVAIYRLDWKNFFKRKEEKFQDWCRDRPSREKGNQHPSIPLTPLPQKYMDLLVDTEFAITSSYLGEIKHQATIGLTEWMRQRGFDSNVREYCLITAQAAIEVAFYLLYDCVYDKKTQYYNRHNGHGLIIKHLMLLFFWYHQTGRGLLKSNADFERLDYVLNSSKRGLPTEDQKIVTDFVSDMDDFLREDNRVVEKVVYNDKAGVEATSPSLDEPVGTEADFQKKLK